VDADDDRHPGAVVSGQPDRGWDAHRTIAFTATRPGTYHYLCPVPGHAHKGMTGTFTVRRS
jgi:plastocyanin